MLPLAHIVQFIDGGIPPLIDCSRCDKEQELLLCHICCSAVMFDDDPVLFYLDDWYLVRTGAAGIRLVNGVHDYLPADDVPDHCRRPNDVLFPPFESGPLYRSECKIAGWRICDGCVVTIEEAITLEDQYRVGASAVANQTTVAQCLLILPRELRSLIISYLAYPQPAPVPALTIINLEYS